MSHSNSEILTPEKMKMLYKAELLQKELAKIDYDTNREEGVKLTSKYFREIFDGLFDKKERKEFKETELDLNEITKLEGQYVSIKDCKILVECRTYDLKCKRLSIENCEFFAKNETSFPSLQLDISDHLYITKSSIKGSLLLNGTGKETHFSGDDISFKSFDFKFEEDLGIAHCQPQIYIRGNFKELRLSLNVKEQSPRETLIACSQISRLILSGNFPVLKIERELFKKGMNADRSGDMISFSEFTCTFFRIELDDDSFKKAFIDKETLNYFNSREFKNKFTAYSKEQTRLNNNSKDWYVFSWSWDSIIRLLKKSETKRELKYIFPVQHFLNSFSGNDLSNRIFSYIRNIVFLNFYSFKRMLLINMALVGLFGVLYFLTKGIHGEGTYSLARFFDSIYFSGVTFTTLGFGDVVPTNYFSKFLSIAESYIGVLMTVLSGWVLVRERG